MFIRCCKDCKDRQVGCHGSCERYLEDRKKLDHVKAIKYKTRQEDIAKDACQYNGLRKGKN